MKFFMTDEANTDLENMRGPGSRSRLLSSSTPAVLVLVGLVLAGWVWMGKVILGGV